MMEVQDAQSAPTDPVPKTKRPSLPANVKAIVWARAAGRCQFRGCNKPLIGDLVSGKADLNTAYIAHVVSDAVKGPRGDEVLSLGLQVYLAQLLFFEACRLAPASVIGPMEYSSVAWACLFGFFMFAETPSAQVLIGGALAVAGGILLALAVRHSVWKTKPPLATSPSRRCVS